MKTVQLKVCSSPACGNMTKRAKCPKCTSREYRANNPVRAAYLNLASHARERRIPFSLTFPHFETFCKETSYIELKGRNKNDLTIDRIDARKGYEDGNIQALTNTQNKKKDIRDRKEGYGAMANAFYLTKNYRRSA